MKIESEDYDGRVRLLRSASPLKVSRYCPVQRELSSLNLKLLNNSTCVGPSWPFFFLLLSSLLFSSSLCYSFFPNNFFFFFFFFPEFCLFQVLLFLLVGIFFLLSFLPITSFRWPTTPSLHRLWQQPRPPCPIRRDDPLAHAPCPTSLGGRRTCTARRTARQWG